jgi:hypothetical protein
MTAATHTSAANQRRWLLLIQLLAPAVLQLSLLGVPAAALPQLGTVQPPALAITSLHGPGQSPSAPIEGGAQIDARLQHPLSVAEKKNVTCNLAWRMDSWSVSAPAWAGTLSPDGTVVRCGAMPPLPAEGPVDFFIAAGANKSNSLPLWTFATFSASAGMTPYFQTDDGELLYRINDTLTPSQWSLSAVPADGGALLLDKVAVLGGDVKRAVPISFATLNASAADLLLNLTLTQHNTAPPLRLQIRLLRVPTLVPGAVAIDHSTRGLLVGGEPFFPVSWMTTMDAYGVEVMVAEMAEMARRGANSIMIYDLGDIGVATYPPPTQAYSYRLVTLMDTAQALGLKIQLHIIAMVSPIAQTGGTAAQWTSLQKFVQAWKRHPALLSWYVADDGSWPHLPAIYTKMHEWDPVRGNQRPLGRTIFLQHLIICQDRLGTNAVSHKGETRRFPQYHPITMAIAGLGDAWQPTYLAGADIVQPENYPGDGPVGLAFETMDIMGRFPYDWAPRVTCGMAWASPITSTAMFRVELYDALAAGGTGSIWFAHRGLKGSWNEPGPLMDQSGVLAKEVMQVSDQEG